MNKRLLIIFGSIGVILLALIIFLAVSFTSKPSGFRDLDNTDQTSETTNNEDEDQDIDTNINEGYSGSSNLPTDEYKKYEDDPTVEARVIFGSSLTYYTHKDLADTTKIKLKPEVRDGRSYILMTGKGCKTLSFYFYENNDGYYNVEDRRYAQNTEYAYVEGPVITDPKKCKDEMRALDPKIKEESLFIFHSLR